MRFTVREITDDASCQQAWHRMLPVTEECTIAAPRDTSSPSITLPPSNPHDTVHIPYILDPLLLA